MLAAGASFGAHADLMVPYSKFKSWPKAKQEKYLKDLRRVAADFENATQKGMEFARLENPLFQWPSFIDAAYAGDAPYCLVGGVRRVMKPNAEGKMVCPTGKRGCGNLGDAGFLCGSIYNDACVTRAAKDPSNPNDTITNRCIQAAGNALPDQARYNERKSFLQQIMASCQNGEIDSRYASQCTRFRQRLTAIEKAYGGAPASDNEWSTIETSAGQDDTPAGEGVPAITELGGSTEVLRQQAPPETCEKPPCPETCEKPPCTTVIETPEEPIKPPKEVVQPPPVVPPTDDCDARNRTKLGDLACIACAMEEWNPADVLTQGGGVTKWVALMGVMAQTYHGPYNVGNKESKDFYLGRVAEMVSAYGYCTDNEYPMNLPNDTRDWLDGSSSLREPGPEQAEFANGFGLMSDKRGGLFQSTPEYTSRPMTLPKQIFDVGRSWTHWNPQHHQWRFRSMLHAHYRSYPNTAFSRCAVRAEARMKNLSSLKMCPIREETWPNGALRTVTSKKMELQEFGQNERFYQKLVTRCHVKVRRSVPNLKCDNSCYHSDAHKHAVAEMPRCERQTPECESGCGNHDKPGEPDHPRPGDGGDGSGDGSSDGGKGGEPGNSRGDGGPSDGSGKGGEPSSTR
jgi:hypothetical protein